MKALLQRFAGLFEVVGGFGGLGRGQRPIATRRYQCTCGQPIFFGNSRCLACGRELGFDPGALAMVVLEPGQTRWQRCDNAARCGCNWLLPPAEAPLHHGLCRACRLNRTIPDLDEGDNAVLWGRIEVAKRRLVSQLLALGLPVRSRLTEDPERGVMFDFLKRAPDGPPVTTGHADGLVTLDIDEADDATRERLRGALDEPYRTLLGHLRHEIGHYYWQRLVAGDGGGGGSGGSVGEGPGDAAGECSGQGSGEGLGMGSRDDVVKPATNATNAARAPKAPKAEGAATAEGAAPAAGGWLRPFRVRFGDERADYAAALERHYREGPVAGWEGRCVSAYASSHPWEDWAETFAHYLHMLDTLDTALSFGLEADDVDTGFKPYGPEALDAPGDPGAERFLGFVNAWLSISALMNELARSMGQPDFYPFVLSAPTVAKLHFVHRVVAAQGVKVA